ALAPLLPEFRQSLGAVRYHPCCNPQRISRKSTLRQDVGFGTVHFWELRITVSVPKQAVVREVEWLPARSRGTSKERVCSLSFRIKRLATTTVRAILLPRLRRG